MPWRVGRSGSAARAAGREVGQLLGGGAVEIPALDGEPFAEVDGDLVEFGRVDPPGDVGEFVGGDIGEGLAPAFEFAFQAEHGLEHLGVGLGRAAHQDAMVAGAEAAEVVARVEAEPDDRGAEPAWAGVGLGHHLLGGLSRLRVESIGRGERSRVPVPSVGSSRHARCYRLPDPARSAPGGRNQARERLPLVTSLMTRPGIPWRWSEPRDRLHEV